MTKMTALEIPVFTLNTVLFPGGLLPLKIFEQRYVHMMKICLRDNVPFGVFLIREGQEVGVPAIPVPVGCLATITHWDMPQQGVFYLQTQGQQVIRIVNQRILANGLIHAHVECLPPEEGTSLQEGHQVCVSVLRKIIDQVGTGHFPAPLNYDDAAWVSYRLAELIPINLHTKQQLLESSNSAARIELLLEVLRDQGIVM